MPIMAKKKRAAEVSKDVATMSLRLPLELRDALDALRKKMRRTLTAEIILAIENHLELAGYWPPEGYSDWPPPEVKRIGRSRE
jgi:hypothetical protein